MNKKKKNTNQDIFMMIGLAITTIILSIYFSGHYMNLPSKDSIPQIELISEIAKSVAKNPMNFKPYNLKVAMNIFMILCIAEIGLYLLFFEGIGSKDKRRIREEYGSASWITKKQKKAFDKKFLTDKKDLKKNIEIGKGDRILSQNYKMTNDTRKTLLNNNELIIGGSGAGKSRGYAKPNILQGNGSYIVVDPSGDILRDTGYFLEQQGYKIKVFNLVEMNKSYRYNPFAYIKKEEDVLNILKIFINNTTDKKASGGDPFWRDAELMFLQSLAYYLVEKYEIKEGMSEEEIQYNKSKVNLIELVRLMDLEKVMEDELVPSELQQLMENHEAEYPNSKAVRFYKKFRSGAGKTLQSILITANTRGSILTSSMAIENLLSSDNLELDMVGEEKTAIFIITPVASKTYNFLAAMMYTQLFDVLYYKGETKYGGESLPIQINFIMDEFANIGIIPEFTEKIATVRKYGINVKIILQSLAQLKTLYKDDWESIVGNCDTLIYLGGNEQSTYEYISKRLGKETITQITTGKSVAKSNSKSYNKGLLGRELLTPDEVGMLDNSKCIVIIRSLPPIMDYKFDYTKHPNYKFTSGFNKEFTFTYKTNNVEVNNELNTNNSTPLREVEVRNYNFSLVSRAPELRKLSELVGNSESKEKTFSNFYLKIGSKETSFDIKLYNESFSDFLNKTDYYSELIEVKN